MAPPLDANLRSTLDEFTAHYRRLGENARVDAVTPASEAALEHLDCELPAVLRAFLALNTASHAFSCAVGYSAKLLAFLKLPQLPADPGPLYASLDVTQIPAAREAVREALPWDWVAELVPFAQRSDGEYLCLDPHPSLGGVVRVGQGGCRQTHYRSVEHLLASHLNRLRRLRTPYDGRERIVVYRLGDLPAALSEGIPADAAVRERLFWAARSESPVVDALMASVPEPKIDYASEGLELAKAVGRLLSQSGLGSALMSPADPAALTWGFSYGFHAAPAEQVEAFFDAADCVQQPISDYLDSLLLLEAVHEDGAPPQDLKVRFGSESYDLQHVRGRVYAKLEAPQVLGPYGFMDTRSVLNVEGLPPHGYERLVLPVRFPEATQPPICAWLRERRDELGYEFLNRSPDRAAARQAFDAFAKADHIGRLFTHLDKRAELSDWAQQHAPAAIAAFSHVPPAYALRSTFRSLYGLMTLIIREGSEASASFLRETIDRLQRGSWNSTLMDPTSNALLFLSGFGESPPMQALHAELLPIENGRAARSEAAQLAELQAFPIKSALNYNAVARLVPVSPSDPVLRLDVCPGEKPTWKLDIRKADGSSDQIWGSRSLQAGNGLPPLHSLLDFPTWLAQVVEQTGWRYERKRIEVRCGRYKKVKAVFVDWILSELPSPTAAR